MTGMSWTVYHASCAELHDQHTSTSLSNMTWRWTSRKTTRPSTTCSSHSTQKTKRRWARWRRVTLWTPCRSCRHTSRSVWNRTVTSRRVGHGSVVCSTAPLSWTSSVNRNLGYWTTSTGWSKKWSTLSRKVLVRCARIRQCVWANWPLTLSVRKSTGSTKGLRSCKVYISRSIDIYRV